MARVPRLKEGPSVKSLNLSPPEAYLLSRVDGLLDEQELAVVTGMTPPQVGAMLDRLAQLGAVEMSGSPIARGAVPPPPSSQPHLPSNPHALIQLDGSPRFDPAELDEPAELEVDRKRRVLDIYYRL